ncbi:hypothetical protein FV227_28480, partial [Methylobacterium sp. WL119]|uniref:Wzz/FepE/Etk N-terminal domain-containing protein n=3 Tax=unclassified Methylobacterium TaxID=2615210 RepID=UPI0011D64473
MAIDEIDLRSSEATEYKSNISQNTALASNQSDRPHQSAEEIVGDILASIRRSRLWLFVWISACVLAAAFTLYRTPSSFTSETTILLDPKRPANLTTDQNAPNYPPALDSAQADSQIQVLKSERLLRLVYDSLSLNEDSDFIPGAPSLLQTILAHIAVNRSNNIQLDTNINTADQAKFQNFTKRVNARRIAQSYVIELSYTASTAEKAARLANSITMAYLGQQITAKAAAAQNGTEFLQGRITALKVESTAVANAIRDGSITSVPLPDADARVIGAALPPSSKSSPQYLLVLT